MRVSIVGWVAVLVVAACGGKGGEPAAGGGGGASGGAPAAGGAGFTKESAQAVVDGVALGEGWEAGLKKADPDGFVLSWRGPKNDRGAAPNVMASGLGCMMGMCPEMSVDKWKANTDNLKMKLSEGLKNAPDLVFEVGETTVEGKKAITVYALGYVEKTDDTGTSRMSTHAFDLYWHDGAKLVTVMTSAGSTGATSLDDLKAKLTRDELEAAGKKVLAAIFAKL
ncbi:MAG: hypothetical protein IT385_13405 [Deltaproteobacteria bacterium]|nr:hypothetical protein [Deltaproteobacteria bacterium]